MGNLAELYYNQSKSEDAIKVIEEARKLTWARLRDFGLTVDQEDINSHGDVNVWADRKRATEEELQERLAGLPATSAPAGGAKGKDSAPPTAKGGAKPAAAKATEEHAADESTETSSLDFSSAISYSLTKADTKANSSKLAPSIYLQGLESLIRFDLRYAQFLTMITKRHVDAAAVLNDTAKLIPRCLYPSPQLKFYRTFLVGHVNRMIFYDKVIEF